MTFILSVSYCKNTHRFPFSPKFFGCFTLSILNCANRPLENSLWFSKLFCPWFNLYLSRLQGSLVNSSKASFAEKILITKRRSCLFHFLESKDWWSMVSFCRSESLIVQLPQLNGLISPCEVHRTLNCELHIFILTQKHIMLRKNASPFCVGMHKRE